MKLPAMKYLEGNRKKTQIKFGGLNHTEGARDGELWDMNNLTDDHYPVLASRSPRMKIKNVTMDVSGGIFHWNKLCWIDAGDFYYDGKRKGGVEEGMHTLAAIGPYIVIFPERFYYNTDTDEFGDLRAFWHGRSLRFGRQGSVDYIECEGVEWEKYFNEGDAVTIGGCKENYNNRTAVIRRIEQHGLMYFDINTFYIYPEEDYTEQGEDDWSLSIERIVPCLDFVCENDNRLWGCDANRIYASVPGNPFRWNNREGLETDGWDVDTGSAGIFTGCISYQGSPIFFKEDRIYKVYGLLPSQYQLVETEAHGVMAGSSKSLSIVDGILFYLSRAGVMAYSGGLPQFVGEAFGLQRFDMGVAGTDGRKYYIGMRDSTLSSGLYTYNPQTRQWFKEGNVDVRGFAANSGILYMQTREMIEVMGSKETQGNIYDRPIYGTPEFESEGPVEWFAEFADFTEDDPDKKGISKIQIRLELDEAATVQAWMMFDSDGQWVPVGSAIGEGKKRSYYLPIIPRRADHYRLKLTGVGGCRIYSLTVETYSGSELKSKEGRN